MENTTLKCKHFYQELKKITKNMKKFQEYNLSAQVQNATKSLGVLSTWLLLV
jgi:hypothetical protein